MLGDRIDEKLTDAKRYPKALIELLEDIKYGIVDPHKYDAYRMFSQGGSPGSRKPLNETKSRTLVNIKNEPGNIYYANITFYGIGGRGCRGKIQIDGTVFQFPPILYLYRKGITDPLVCGWYISMWDTARDIYGVMWTTNDPISYYDVLNLNIRNTNSRTSDNENDVEYEFDLFTIKNKER